jgi:VanZ family protein
MRKYLPIFRLTIFASFALAILWLSLAPHPPLPKTGLLSWDKAQHAMAYAVLALLGGWALEPLMGNGLRAWRRGAAIAILYGVLLEMAQMLLTRSRSAQIGDAVADAVGALAAYFGVWLAATLRECLKQPEGE